MKLVIACIALLLRKIEKLNFILKSMRDRAIIKPIEIIRRRDLFGHLLQEALEAAHR